MRIKHLPLRYDTLLKGLQILAALLAGFFVCFPITDSDIFWHLAAGREMVARFTFLHHDPFSYTTPHAQWIDLHWLFQVGMYLVERTGGFALLLVVKALSVAAAAWLTFSAFPRSRATVAAAFGAAIVIYCQRYLVPLRPIVITLLLIGLFIASLERYCRTGKRRYLFAALIAQVTWVNVQGLFMLGPVIAAAYGIGEYCNRWAGRRAPRLVLYRAELTTPQHRLLLVFPFALIAASLVNPYGRQAIFFSMGLFARINPASSNLYSRTITENMPLLQMVGTGYSAYVAIAAVIVLALALTTLFAPRTIRFAHCGLAAAGLLLAVMAQRNGILLTFLALPCLLWNVNHASLPLPKSNADMLRNVALTAALLIAVYAVVNHARLLTSWPHALSPFSYPAETTSLMKKTPLPGNLFNADRYGGYLLWHLYPPRQVSSDTRLTMRSGAFFREYLSLTDQPELFDEYARRWDITQVVLPVAPIDRYLPLAAALYRHPRWKLAFTDGAEAFFVADTFAGYVPIDLDSPPAIDAITDALGRRFTAASPLYDEALTYLGRWCAAAGAYTGAQRALAPCSSIGSRRILADVKMRQGFNDDAEKILLSVIADHPRNSDARLQLVLFYLRTGRREEGLRQLSLLLKKDPFNKNGRNILFRLSEISKEKP